MPTTKAGGWAEKDRRVKMPNWVNHNLTITGPETERKRFMAECFSQANDETNFDFDKLVPEPEHIEDEGNDSGGVRRPLSRRMMEALQLRKFPAWYVWRLENWCMKSLGTRAIWQKVSNRT